MTRVRRIGLLTGGGDCPGLNAVIRAVTKEALARDTEVLGIEDGFLGLIEDRLRPLSEDDVSNILTFGGTILGSSNKANPERFVRGLDEQGAPIVENVVEQCAEVVHRERMDGLIVVGGDGTMTCAQPFVERGIACIGVPKTIDNDIFGTDLSFGFLTAVNTASEALDKVHSTAESHHRVMVVEVMGRNAGWIALYSGVASGADVILLPEIPFRIQAVADAILERKSRGKRFSILCVAEGAAPAGGELFVERTDPTSPDPVRLGGVGRWVANEVERITGIESRAIVLGHVQRGGTPLPSDRILGTQFGHHALELLYAGKINRMVAMQGLSLTDVDIREPAGRQRRVPLDDGLVQAARAIRTSFGDE